MFTLLQRGSAPTWSSADLARLADARVLVTGANSGLGLEITKSLAAAGAEVQLACRNPVKARAAVQQVLAETPSAKLEVLPLDLADLESVAALADDLIARPDARLDLLVNNAGLMAVDQARTAQGLELQWGVNHLGHFALTGRLLPLLQRSSLATRPRVATMASMGHRGATGAPDPRLDRPYRRWGSYFHSKLANIQFTAELERRLRVQGSRVLAVAAHPGGSLTDLGTEGSSWFNRVGTRVYPYVAQSATVGARPMLRAISDPTTQGGDF